MTPEEIARALLDFYGSHGTMWWSRDGYSPRLRRRCVVLAARDLNLWTDWSAWHEFVRQFCAGTGKVLASDVNRARDWPWIRARLRRIAKGVK